MIYKTDHFAHLFQFVAESKVGSLMVSLGTIFMSLITPLSVLLPVLDLVNPVLSTIGIFAGILVSISLYRYHNARRRQVEQEIKLNKSSK
ncbi:MAG: hypothetical protein K6L81_01860 [Agarilytica sp.]